jgi:peroxiredoxin
VRALGRHEERCARDRGARWVQVNVATAWRLGLLVAVVSTACSESTHAPSRPVAADAAPASPVASATAPNALIVDPLLADPLVGTRPPDWSAEEWIGSPPLTLAGLRGKVVLVRWFMGPTCPLCSATARSLRTLHADFAARGLVVVGLYHHKEDTPLTVERYRAQAAAFDFPFPVALDRDWKTLRAWWLDGHEREFTSVSFLLDRQGRIRGIHAGGRYAPGEPSYVAMRRAVETLLLER